MWSHKLELQLAFNALLPAALATAWLLRVNLISLIYGISLLAYPLIPGPQPHRIVPGKLRIFTVWVLVIGLLSGVAQLIHQVFLLADTPYGHMLPPCSFIERVCRQLGFQRLDTATMWEVMRLLSSEIVLCFSAFYCYNVCKRSNYELTAAESLMQSVTGNPICKVSHGGYKLYQMSASHSFLGKAFDFSQEALSPFRGTAGCFLLFTVIAGAGIVNPCLLSFPYFLFFLGSISYWALKPDTTEIRLQPYRVFLACYSGGHLLLLYLFQFDAVQRVVDPFGLGARLMGLTRLLVHKCGANPRAEFAPESIWPYFANIFFLGSLYCVSACQFVHNRSKRKIVQETRERVSREEACGGDGLNRHLIKRVASVKFAKTLDKVYRESEVEQLLENEEGEEEDKKSGMFEYQAIEPPSDDQLSIASEELLEKSNLLESPDGPPDLVRLENGNFMELKPSTDPIVEKEKEKSRKDKLPRHSSLKRAFGNRLQQWTESGIKKEGPIMTVLHFVHNQSYVLQLCMMMAWSITYHSWSTFILLFLACLVWLVPDPRSFALRLSPFLALYAELLLFFQFVYGVNLTESELHMTDAMKQIGLEKATSTPPCIPLFVKSMFTLSFCATLRQHMQETRQKRSEAWRQVFFQHALRMDLTAFKRRAEADDRPVERMDATAKVKKLGVWLRSVLVQYWIFMAAGILMFIALRMPVSFYRVIYMVFFLVFISAFQISLKIWRAILHAYYIVMIVYCMIVLSLIYTYQFFGFPEMWAVVTGWTEDVMSSIGLEKYTSAELFVKLLSPISFLIITIIQLNFFHKDLMIHTEAFESLRPSAMQSREISIFFDHATEEEKKLSPCVVDGQDEFIVIAHSPGSRNSVQMNGKAEILSNPTPTLSAKLRGSQQSFVQDWTYFIFKGWQVFSKYQHEIAEIIWHFLEIHITKLIGLTMMLISVFEVSAINVPYVIILSLSMSVPSLEVYLSHIASLWTSIVIISKMLYQMRFVKEEELLVNCTGSFATQVTGNEISKYIETNATAWAGLHKTDDISGYLKGYIILILLLSLQSLVYMRQQYVFTMKKGKSTRIKGVLFPWITCQHMDDGLSNCLLYLINYGFYRFGLEINCVSIVSTIGVRLDGMATVYGIILIIILIMRRPTVAKFWHYYVAFLTVSLPVQYLWCLGMPMTSCSNYPWSRANENLIEWLYLPHHKLPPNSRKLIADFLQLVMACCQLHVFNIEMSEDYETYPGGENNELVYEDDEADDGDLESISECPVPDFITFTRSYLDVIKVGVFMHLYWVTLAIVFIAGVSRVTLFAMGYVVASFLFLWNGNELFLKPLPFALKLWNMLLGYNCIVIFIKPILQVIGCAYVQQLYRNYCWMLQIFGIACLKIGTNADLTVDGSVIAECSVPTEEAGVFYDCLCFCFLLFQRRIFSSHYFKHVIAEFRAQQIFASRGAELINQLTTVEIEEQQKKEGEIVSKIKKKMDKIRQSQNAGTKNSFSRRKSAAAGLVQQRAADVDPYLQQTPSPYQGSEVSAKQEHSHASAISYLNNEYSSASLMPLDQFDDQDREKSRIHQTSEESLLALNSTGSFRTIYHFLPSPHMVRREGLHAARIRLLAGPGVPIAVPEDFTELRLMTPNSAPCNFAGPHVALTPLSQHLLSYLTTPPRDEARPRALSKTFVRQRTVRKPSKKSKLYKVQERTRKPGLLLGKASMSSRQPSASTGQRPALKRQQRLQSMIAPPDGKQPRNNSSDSDEELMSINKTRHSIIPDTEEDRRKGLGPLQLLNAALTKGAIKDAVKDAKLAEESQIALENRLQSFSGRTDRKLVRKELKKMLSFCQHSTQSQMPDATVVNTTKTVARPDILPLQQRFQSMEFDGQSLHAVGKNDGDYSASTLLTNEDIFAEEENTSDVESEGKSWLCTKLVEPLCNAWVFAKLVFVGTIESLTVTLMKVSRKYRYVAHVLAEEKRMQKELDIAKKVALLRMDTFLAKRDISNQSFLSDSLKATSNSNQTKKNVASNASRGQSNDSDGSTSRILNRLVNVSETYEQEMKKFDEQRNLILRLLFAIYYVLISRSELICYLMMVLNHMASASLISMLLPLLAFLWGTLSLPRPSRLFWISIITYTETVVIIKYLFQFGFFPWNKGDSPEDPFWPPRLLGIERKTQYAAWDLALLMVLFSHRSILKSLGLWKDVKIAETDTNMLPEDYFCKTRASLASGYPEIDAEDNERLDNATVKGFSFRRQWWKKGVIAYVVQFVCFFGSLLKPRNCYSVDVYAPMFLCDFICFFIVVFGFKGFGRDTGAGGVASYFEENKVILAVLVFSFAVFALLVLHNLSLDLHNSKYIPGAFIAMLIVQFALIIVDRALFLRKFLFGKLMYQLGLVIFVHMWMFIILPAVTERRFIDNTPAKLWYFTKCVYFIMSAWQIRSGYPTRVLGNFLTKQFNLINIILFKAFMLIPFLFELRALMDWIWTDTCLSLPDWLTFEDIFSSVYEIKCTRKFEEDYPTPKGTKKKPLIKYGCGGLALFGIILIIWFPLVLFSLANTVGLRNIPFDCTAKLTIGGYEPAFLQKAQQRDDLRALTETEYADMMTRYDDRKYALNYMADYTSDDVIQTRFNGDSSQVWEISPPAKVQLIEDLQSSFDVVIKFEWLYERRSDDPFDPGILSSSHEVALKPGDEIRAQLVDMIQLNRTEPIIIPRLFPPYVKIPSKGDATFIYPMIMDYVKEDETEAFIDVSLALKTDPAKKYIWWQLQMLNHPFLQSDIRTPHPPETYLLLIGFVDKVFPATFNRVIPGAGGGILSLYVSLVLFVGRFIRMLVTGSAQKIMFEELPNCDRLLQLCLDIFLVRESKELALEQDLYARLIFLYRSPETLIKWTQEKSS